MIRQAVIAAGGKGTRLGALARKYGNKSLVLIQGLPILNYTLNWLDGVEIEEVIITANYMAEYRRIKELFGADPRIRMAYNNYRKSSAQCIPPLKKILDPQFLFVYGHAPVPLAHLKNLVLAADEGIVVSLYRTTSQGETRKPARLSEGYVILDPNGRLFIEPPHILNHEFIELLENTGSWGKSFQRYRGSIKGVQAHHPSEFHYPRDFAVLRRFMSDFLRKVR